MEPCGAPVNSVGFAAARANEEPPSLRKGWLAADRHLEAGMGRKRTLALVLYEAKQGPVRIDQIGDGKPAIFLFGRMKARHSPALLREPRVLTSVIKGRHIFQAKAATETALCGVQIRIRKKFQGELTALKDHPAVVFPALFKP